MGAGCTNMVLDVLMVGVLRWGVEGAAIATFISQLVGGVLPVLYHFIDHNNTSRLHLCRTQSLRQCAAGCLHQRFFRADDQPFHVAGEHPL